MNFASATNITDTVIIPSKDMISALYASTYSNVGDDFLDTLVKEIGTMTGAQTVMIQRLLTFKEYHDLKDNEGCPAIQLVTKEQQQNSRETSPIISDTENNHGKVEYLLVKACYSTISNYEAL